MKKTCYNLILFLFIPLIQLSFSQTPQFYNYTTQGIANSFPFNQAAGKKAQWIILPNEYNQPSPATSGTIISFYFFCAPTYPLNATYTQFYIRMGRSALTNLPTGSFYSGPMDTVFYRASGYNINVAASTWWQFVLDSSFTYYPDSSLIIEIGQCSSTQGSGFSTMQQNAVTQRKLYSVGGCPFVYGGAQETRTFNSGITVTPLAVNNNNNKIPNAYFLNQNYPNPFNPVTAIGFGIPKSGNVKLTIYDMLGREISVLTNTFYTAGTYSINFDATEFSSGVYLYMIEADGFVSSRKLTLVK